MADKILSQVEVNALLSAMDKGKVDLDLDAEVNEAKHYDLTSQSTVLREQFGALEEAYDKFTTSLKKSLKSYFQRPIDVKFVSMDLKRFGEFFRSFRNPTSLNIFTMEPLIGSALLVFESNLVFPLIDCMFGGDGKPLKQNRGFTLIEQRMMNKFSVEILSKLENALREIYQLKITLRKSETKPKFFHLYETNELVMVVVFSVNGKEFSGDFHLCFSYVMLEPIRDKLSSVKRGHETNEHPWGAQLHELIKSTRVNLSAELGRSNNYNVNDLLNLKVGDIISLDTGPQDAITIAIEGVPKYSGFPGIVKGNRAVQISALQLQFGGMNSHARR